jgi:hypothetical protein
MNSPIESMLNLSCLYWVKSIKYSHILDLHELMTFSFISYFGQFHSWSNHAFGENQKKNNLITNEMRYIQTQKHVLFANLASLQIKILIPLHKGGIRTQKQQKKRNNQPTQI